ncbi:MAG: GNAT family N-acetyltransferase [Steroidobacteraceae bacterium]
MTGYTIRRTTVGDAAVIAQHRVSMFRDMGQVPTQALAVELLNASQAELATLLREGSYVGWLAVGAHDEVLAGAGAHIRPTLPRITHEGRVATGPLPLAVNVYTEPGSRRRGIARALMQAMMEWGRAQGFDRLLLHASDAARPLYRSLGFAPTNEMRWSINDTRS